MKNTNPLQGVKSRGVPCGHFHCIGCFSGSKSNQGNTPKYLCPPTASELATAALENLDRALGNVAPDALDTIRALFYPATICCERSKLADGTIHDSNCPVLMESLRENKLCRECLVWSGTEDPTRHGVNCSQRKGKL